VSNASAVAWRGEVAKSAAVFDADTWQADTPIKLSHFDQAAIVVSLQYIRNGLVLVGRLRECSQRLNDFSESGGFETSQYKSPKKAVMPDLDRLQGVAFLMLLTAGCFVLWVLVDPPGHQSIWSVPPILGLLATSMPHIRTGNAHFKVFGMALPVCILIYIFIMPKLSSFAGLSLLIFLYMFITQYVLRNPLAVMLACAGFMVITGISNNQSYDFVGVALAYLFVLISASLLIAFSYFLGTPRPEKKVLWLLSRFFNSASQMTASTGQPETWLMRFHHQELALLPVKLKMWGSQINHVNYPGVSAEQLGQLVINLEVMNYRLNELLDISRAHQSRLVKGALSHELEGWASAIQSIFQRLVKGQDMANASQLRTRLSAQLETIEHDLSEWINSDETLVCSRDELANAYRLLSAYRGLSIAVLDFVELTESLNIGELRQECFS
ncbi:MAG: FUSC family protein, partial [Gammaproteobacteria bacterium]